MRKKMVALAVALAALAVGAGPAAGDIPNGHGLVSFGTFQCDGLGKVEVFGPAPPQVPFGFFDTGQRFVMRSLDVVFTDAEGNVVDAVRMTWGTKAGLSTVTCRQDFEGGSGTAIVALVPPA
jgi:hypothetical protein